MTDKYSVDVFFDMLSGIVQHVKYDILVVEKFGHFFWLFSPVFLGVLVLEHLNTYLAQII